MRSAASHWQRDSWTTPPSAGLVTNYWPTRVGARGDILMSVCPTSELSKLVARPPRQTVPLRGWPTDHRLANEGVFGRGEIGLNIVESSCVCLLISLFLPFRSYAALCMYICMYACGLYRCGLQRTAVRAGWSNWFRSFVS